jgi:methyl-accepting chemotaxis protein
MSSLKARATLFCVLLALFASTIAGGGLFASKQVGNAIDDIANSAVAIRNHTVGDMLHDGLRADVYAALFRADLKQDGAETLEETTGHAREFRERIEATMAIVESKEAKATLSNLDGPLNDYISQAERIVVLAFKDRQAALAEMPLFDKRFLALEEAMEAAGDVLETDARTAQAKASRSRQMADWLGLGGLLVALFAAVVLFVLVSRNIVRPITDIESTMRDLGNGRTEIAIPHSERKDEIGSMARTITVFRRAIDERAEQERARVQADLASTEDRRRMLAEMTRQIGVVVDAAARGDFSERIVAHDGDKDLAGVSRRLNELVQTIDEGLGETIMVLSTLSSGDLTIRVSGQYRGAFDALKSGTNTLADSLADALGRLADSAVAVRTATGEISMGIHDLATRTAEQATTVNETCAALDRFTDSIRENAGRAGQAADVVRAAESQARQGGTVLTSAREAMNRISTSSGRISDIVELIDGIAFQTNLLALNAAVEAARAGEVGRGFAVVASEVRTLAQRAAVASQEIKTLIDQAQSEIASGVSLVEETSNQLGSIFTAVSNVSGVISAIAQTSNEQATTIGGLNDAVNRLGDVAQQNASLVEETHAAIQTTEEETARLEGLAGQFTFETRRRRPYVRAA